MRLRGDADSHIGPLVEPPEELGTSKGGIPSLRRHIQRLGLKQMIRLLPEAHFHCVAVEPAIANNSVLLRQDTREYRRLGCASHSGQHFTQWPQPALAG